MFEILTKNIGAVPKNKPIVVKPKANPGVFFNTDVKIANVIDIVILKNITPIKEINIKDKEASSLMHKINILKKELNKNGIDIPNIDSE